MQIECIPAGILGTNCYFVINEDTKEIAIIDPGGYSKKMKTTITENGYIPAAILLTHGHFDHMMGVAPLLEDYPVPVYIMAAEEDILLDPQKNLSAKYTEGCTLEGVMATVTPTMAVTREAKRKGQSQIGRASCRERVSSPV